MSTGKLRSTENSWKPLRKRGRSESRLSVTVCGLLLRGASARALARRVESGATRRKKTVGRPSGSNAIGSPQQQDTARVGIAIPTLGIVRPTRGTRVTYLRHSKCNPCPSPRLPASIEAQPLSFVWTPLVIRSPTLSFAWTTLVIRKIQPCPSCELPSSFKVQPLSFLWTTLRNRFRAPGSDVPLGQPVVKQMCSLNDQQRSEAFQSRHQNLQIGFVRVSDGERRRHHAIESRAAVCAWRSCVRPATLGGNRCLSWDVVH